MSLFMQKMNYNTNEKIIRNRLLCMKLGCMLIIAFLFAGISIHTAQAASGLQIYSYTTKKTSNYTGKQVRILYNGKQINTDPGIIIDDIALVSYKDIFVNSPIGVDYEYNKAKGTITISKNNVTIIMTINSKKATVNGKAVNLPAAPVKIKYIASDITKILVPSRFVSENLGYEYTWYSDRSTVEIVKKTISVSYNSGKMFEYTGTQGLVTIDGKKVELDTMPSVILNNTAMLRAKKVFADSVIDADYNYNENNNTVTLSKNDIELIMTIGSKVAKLNGKSVSLTQGPIIIKNYDDNTSYIMVPGWFTATSLGYNYYWDKDISTSEITTKTDTGSGNSNQGSDHGGSNNDPGTILYQMQASDAFIGKSTGIHDLNEDFTSNGTRGFIYSVARDYSNVKKNSETFAFTSNSPFSKVTSDCNGKKLTIKASNMEATNQTYQMYGSNSSFVNTVTSAYDTADMNMTLTFDLLPDNITYDLSLSQDKLVMYVTVYTNSISSAVIGTNTKGDYLTLTGINPESANISEQNGYLYIDLPYTTNGLGDLYTNITGAKFVNLIYTIGLTDSTRLILQLNDGYDYVVSENGDQYTVSFIASGSDTQPDPPTDIDPGNYEVIIPKPAGISNDVITHEDYYYYNQFSIKIPGDYTSYYTNHPVAENSSIITNFKVFLNSDNETEIKFTTSKLQGYKFVADSSNIYVHVGNPKDIYKDIVVLDPGHGGPANGAEYFGTKEKNVNLQILYTIGKKYFNSDPWKLKVYYTRTSDVDMTLSNRASFASKVGADLFVSLHMNASTASSAKGTEVYYSTSNNSPNQAGLTSKKMAEIFVNNVSDTMGTQNRGAKAERYTVVHRNTVPAVLIELGFLSNQSDHALITNSASQEKAVKEIYDTILQIFDEYPTGR